MVQSYVKSNGVIIHAAKAKQNYGYWFFGRVIIVNEAGTVDSYIVLGVVHKSRDGIFAYFRTPPPHL